MVVISFFISGCGGYTEYTKTHCINLNKAGIKNIF